jgi:hypothetical protein
MRRLQWVISPSPSPWSFTQWSVSVESSDQGIWVRPRGHNVRPHFHPRPRAQLTSHVSSYAVCAVRLKNKGIDAYQPEVYGDSITIERRINVDSSGGYKIKNHAGKTIETKKMVLDAICTS